MTTPLWYKISHHELSFKEFLDREFTSYDDIQTLFSETEQIEFFIWCLLYNHSPYIDGKHLLTYIPNQGQIHIRFLRFVYLYGVLKVNPQTEKIFDNAQNKLNMTMQIPSNYVEILERWLGVIFRSFVDVGPLNLNLLEYSSGDRECLEQVLDYSSQLDKRRLFQEGKQTKQLYRLFQLERHLLRIKDFLLGISLPSFLEEYRNDPDFFQSVVKMSRPAVLKLLDSFQTMSSREEDEIKEHFLLMLDYYDFGFLLDYITLFQESFGEHPLTLELQGMVKPSPENELKRIKSLLDHLTPMERRLYFPTILPISDKYCEWFLGEIKEQGLDKVLTKLLKQQRTISQKTHEYMNYTIVNISFYLTGYDIYLYSPLLHVSYCTGKDCFIFHPEEVSQLKGAQNYNPYNREKLPEDFSTEYYPYDVSVFYEKLGVNSGLTLPELWSNIIKRKMDISI